MLLREMAGKNNSFVWKGLFSRLAKLWSSGTKKYFSSGRLHHECFQFHKLPPNSYLFEAGLSQLVLLQHGINVLISKVADCY